MSHEDGLHQIGEGLTHVFALGKIHGTQGSQTVVRLGASLPIPHGVSLSALTKRVGATLGHGFRKGDSTQIGLVSLGGRGVSLLTRGVQISQPQRGGHTTLLGVGGLAQEPAGSIEVLRSSVAAVGANGHVRKSVQTSLLRGAGQSAPHADASQLGSTLVSLSSGGIRRLHEMLHQTHKSVNGTVKRSLGQTVSGLGHTNRLHIVVYRLVLGGGGNGRTEAVGVQITQGGERPYVIGESGSFKVIHGQLYSLILGHIPMLGYHGRVGHISHAVQGTVTQHIQSRACGLTGSQTSQSQNARGCGLTPRDILATAPQGGGVGKPTHGAGGISYEGLTLQMVKT